MNVTNAENSFREQYEDGTTNDEILDVAEFKGAGVVFGGMLEPTKNRLICSLQQSGSKK